MNDPDRYFNFRKSLIDFAGEYFNRGNLLEDSGWCSHVPAIKFLSDFSTEEEFKEFWAVETELQLTRICGESYYSELLRKKRLEFQENRHIYSRYEYGITALKRKMHNLDALRDESFVKALMNTKEEILRCRGIELIQHSSEHSRNFEIEDKNSARVFVKNIIAQEDLLPGFTEIRDSLKSKFLIFKKDISDRLCNIIYIPKIYLKPPLFSTLGKGSLTFLWGVFGQDECSKISNIRNLNTDHMINNNWTFPINVLFSGPLYEYYENYNELECLIRAHSNMYRLTSHDVNDRAREFL
ncbi:hypothetical protein BTA51_28285 [Hahella sp. CCB-MM4]|uniref:hypothetical protein n=1 Tax=Hahella sp. (strain CCB-MM4) TaxID=1926491 RepID=UPI000B9C038D|nr:hypothetical protein [Hahella sp. CCB-MM4]OZG70029.1 hypothetical protein BTA51_28285 [Hahella sp. CCB-MM4]